MMRQLLASGVAVLTVALFVGVAAGQEVTSGTIEGTVTDAAGAPLSGATVTITSDQGTKTETTDAAGGFRFPYLTAGQYDLRVTQEGYTTAEREDLDVRLGTRVRLDVAMTAGRMEVVNVVGRVPTVDISTATSGATVGAELMSSIPMGRSFSNAVALAPGVVGSGIDDANPSISGASGLENTYVVDGVNINNTGYGSVGSYSIVFGSLGTGVNFDYIKEVQIKTGGYEPEYGESLGGFVNLVTKTGGNELTGSAFVYSQPSSFEGDREKDTRLEAEYDVTAFQTTDVGFEVGGPIVENEAFFYGAFNPTFIKETRASAEATGFDHELDAERTIYNYAANLKWFANANHSFSVSAFGDPSKGDMGAQREDAVAVADPESRFSEIRYGGNNFVARWEAELHRNHSFEASFALHKDKFEEDLAVSQPSGTDRGGVIDGDPNTTSFYGGPGFFSNSESDNKQYRLKLQSFVEAAGQHQFRYGVEFQNVGYTNEANYSGEAGTLIPMSVDNGVASGSQPAATGYSWDIDANATRFRINRIRTGQILAETTNDYLAFFASDSWKPVDWLNLMAGIRYEEDKIEGNASEYTFGDNWAPRFHATIDPTRDGKTKLSFAWGRFFGKIPNDLAVRALSTEVTHLVYYDIADVDLSDPSNPVIPDPSLATDMITFGDEPTVITDDAKLTYQDEFVASAEREVYPLVNVGLTYMHRSLGRTLEDVALSSYSGIVNGT
jgi:hypothetical protein